MSQAETRPVALPLIPAGARDEWLALTRLLDELPPVPCRVASAETWWPDKRDANGSAAHGAVAACHRCPAEAACLAYALAADERFGVSGGTLPDERRANRWSG